MIGLGFFCGPTVLAIGPFIGLISCMTVLGFRARAWPLLIVYMLFSWQPIWAMSCDGAMNQRFEFEAGEFELFDSFAQRILSDYPPSQYFYVGVGRSPAVLMAILASRSPENWANLPASAAKWMTFYKLENPDSEVVTHFNRFLPTTETLGGRKVLLIDHVQSGLGLKNVKSLAQGILGRNHVDSLVVVQEEALENHRYLLSDGGHFAMTYEEEAQLTRFASERYDHVAQYGEAVLTRDLELLADVSENPGHQSLLDAVRERLNQD